MQKKLSETVLYWYILPAIPGLLLFVVGFIIGFEVAIEIQFLLTILLIALGLGLNILNKNVAKKEFLPRLRKIDAIITDMQE